ncbi:MAG: RIP metalloprotease RseP, partial [Kiritimatiellaeota bacterium]|nr:RIP metalloprotease RseP [Kiritimatiellota bacterium]
MTELLVDVLRWVLAGVGVLLLFGVTVFVHELGHFLAARALGFQIDTFSIGFGPAVWRRKAGKTVYKIGCVPFGGYVALPQLDPSGMDAIQGKNGETVREAIPPVAWWRRIVVALAGPFGNVVLAIVIALLVAALPPPENLSTNDGAIVGFVGEGSAAERAGLLIGDSILAVDETAVATWYEFMLECHSRGGVSNAVVTLTVSNTVEGASARTLALPLEKDARRNMTFVPGIGEAYLCHVAGVVNSPAERVGITEGDIILSVDDRHVFGHDSFTRYIQDARGSEVAVALERNGERHVLRVTPEWHDEAGRWMIGVVTVNAEMTILPWLKYHRPWWRQLHGDTASITRILKSLVAPKHKGEAGQIAGALGGPVSILTSMWFGLLTSLLSTLAFIRFLNINLAIINLLPLPVLDGGHILFALYEGVTRRKIHPKVLDALMNVFVVLILIAFALLTFKDVRSI